MTTEEETASAPAIVSEEWYLVFDEGTQRDYYFNIITQASLWERPKEVEGYTVQRYEDIRSSSDEDRASERETEEEREGSSPSSPEAVESDGWHYMDMSSQMQGPFEKDQLMSWRGHFPMNTLMWTDHQIKSNKEEDRSVRSATFLADVLDDHRLLLQWQSQTPNHVNEMAPTAPAYEHYLKYPVAQEAEEVEMDLRTHTRSYEDAVLAGLPAEDETAELVDLARQSGTPLTEIKSVVAAASNDGTAQQLIVTDPYTGKMTAVASEMDEGHALYAEFGSWIDPSKLGDGLTKSAKYRREKLPSLWMKQVGYKKRVLPWQDEKYDRGDYD